MPGMLVSLRILITAGVFGSAALAILLADLKAPIPGTCVVSDPRELLTTTGAAPPVSWLIVQVEPCWEHPAFGVRGD
jgi:hypothetical protein